MNPEEQLIQKIKDNIESLEKYQADFEKEFAEHIKLGRFDSYHIFFARKVLEHILK